MIVPFCFLLLLQLGAGEEECLSSAKLDMQIIVDSSMSVGKKDFQTMMKKISSSIVGEMEIGPEKTRVALFKYSKKGVMKSEFNLDRFESKTEMQKSIESTKFEPGNTMTAMAMNQALKSFKKHQRKDSETPRVCLVFTDGAASDGNRVPSATKAWADDGVTVFAIGIGAKLKHKGLAEIAGADNRAFEVENFDAIAELAKGLLKQVCKEVVKPTRRPRVEHLVEINWNKGTSGATSIYSSTHSSLMAFVKQIRGSAPWSNAANVKLPVIVWSKLQMNVKVARLSFASRIDRCCWLHQSPTDFELVGSNDCQSWVSIAQYHTKWSRGNQVQTWDVPKDKRKSFSCIGIRVNRVHSGPHAAIQGLRMWAEPNPTPKEVLKEIDWRLGSAGATSTYSSTHSFLMAFVKQTRGKYPWASAAKDKLPVVVWSKLQTSVKVGRFSFASRIDHFWLSQAPTDFELVGSNDCKSWVSIAHMLHTKWSRKNQVQIWDVPRDKRQSFSCVGIRINRVHSGPYAAIQGLRMWAEVPDGYQKGSDGIFYKLHKVEGKNNTTDAKMICNTEGGYLAVMLNEKDCGSKQLFICIFK